MEFDKKKKKSFLGIKMKTKMLEVHLNFLIVFDATDLWWNEGKLFFFLSKKTISFHL